MVESKNLKLKLGLCGLALTSFLALNARGNTVHADTVSGSNANAITWDADNDDSQVVKEDSNQSQPTQSVQTQAPAVQKQQVAQSAQPKQSTVQSAPVQNKVEQPAQKQAPVQSNVQNRQSQSKVATSNVSSSSVVQNRAEKSIVRQSNFETSTVNRLNADNRANYVKVANVDATVTNNSNHVDIDIGDPFGELFNGNVAVHWVDKNGRNIKGISSDKDYKISIDKYFYTNAAHDAGQEATYSGEDIVNGKYNVPAGYQLLYPQGTYDLKNHPATLQSSLPDQVATDDMEVNDGTYVRAAVPKAEYDKANQAWQRFIVDQEKRSDEFRQWADGTYNRQDDTSYHLELYAYDDKSDILDGHLEAGFVSGYGSITENGVNFKWNASNSNINDLRTIIKFMNDYCYKLIDNSAFHMVPNYEVGGPDFRFTDNSGNARQGATANTVNVILTKPASVDPNSANCKRQAQRVIHVTFPNGVKPKSYDSITDSKGNKLTLDSNNNLTQTVTFTRSVTVDGLTGATLNQTPWKQSGAINAVTLPAIPGYTMVTNTK